MRLGETYLIAAEAALGTGNAGVAAQMINVLRTRAACDPTPATAPTPTLGIRLSVRDLSSRLALTGWRDERSPSAPLGTAARRRPHHPGAIWKPKWPPFSGRWKGYA